MRRLVLAMTFAIAACGDTKPVPAQDPPPTHPVSDAGVTRTNAQPIDPGNDMHLDDDVAKRPVQQPPPGRPSKPIDVILRSTPSGANAYVDGMPIGPTPAYWAGTADGRPHDFTFTLEGHEAAHYKFVPITNGVIHARLTPVDTDVDAGLGAPQPPPEITPPDAAVLQAPAPPPTVISPDAAVAPLPVGPQP